MTLAYSRKIVARKFWFKLSAGCALCAATFGSCSPKRNQNTKAQPVIDDFGLAIQTIHSQLKELSSEVQQSTSKRSAFALSSFFAEKPQSTKNCEARNGGATIIEEGNDGVKVVQNWSHEDTSRRFICKDNDLELNWKQQEDVDGLHLVKTVFQSNGPTKQTLISETTWHWLRENGSSVVEKRVDGQIATATGFYEVKREKQLRMRYSLDRLGNETERSFVSGELTVRERDGLELSMQFNNVKLKSDSCAAFAGKINGVQKRQGKEEAFEITFSELGPVINFQGKDLKSSALTLVDCQSLFTQR